ncbi:hypothetical protein ACNKHU_25715 [Shigella flexneri]
MPSRRAVTSRSLAFYVLVETDHRGAMMGGWLGLITAVVLMILGPTIWVQIP